MAELLLENKERVRGVSSFIDGKDNDGAVVADDVAGGAYAVGFLDVFGVDGEDFAVEAFVRGEDVGFAGLELGGGDEQAGHLRRGAGAVCGLGGVGSCVVGVGHRNEATTSWVAGRQGSATCIQPMSDTI